MTHRRPSTLAERACHALIRACDRWALARSNRRTRRIIRARRKAQKG